MVSCLITRTLLKLSILLSFVLIGLLLFPKEISAQDTLQRMSVTPTSSEARGTVFRNHPDKAGIIFESAITNLRFSSNMDGIVEVNSQPQQGRYVLIIDPFTQIISIEAPGFIQERIRIGSPSPRDVLFFTIEPEESQSDMVSVFFDVQPSDARLFIEGQLSPVNETVQLTSGEKALRIERDGYLSIEENIEVSAENILFEYTLEEVDIVPVRIQSNITGAEVSIDGNVQGEIDRSGLLGLWLYPGSYILEIRHSGYMTQTREITVTQNEENHFSFELDRNIGELSLNITPPDAEISINRQDYTGQQQIELAPGRYRLDVEKEGYEPYTESFDLERNQRLNRRINLTQHTGSLRFNITPGNANVTLQNPQGQSLENWQGIRYIRNLPVGRYRLHATASGYEDWSDQLSIAKDKEELIEVTLEKLTFASLSITTNVPAAGTLSKNGREIGSWRGDNSFNRLETGDYTVLLNSTTYDGKNYKSLRKKIFLKPGENLYDLKLKRKYNNKKIAANVIGWGGLALWIGAHIATYDRETETYSSGTGRALVFTGVGMALLGLFISPSD